MYLQLSCHIYWHAMHIFIFTLVYSPVTNTPTAITIILNSYSPFWLLAAMTYKHRRTFVAVACHIPPLEPLLLELETI